MPIPRPAPDSCMRAGAATAASVLAELHAGLSAPAAHVAPKFFYDTLGSRLFEAICALSEYYPTRMEAAIFDAHGADIAQAAGTGATLIDLGAGNCAKAERLFNLLRPAQYVPVDIAADFLAESVQRLHQRFPGIDIVPLGCDFSSELTLPDPVRTRQRLFFYPGSSIGNFAPDQACAFLQRVRQACGDDGAVLIGIDLLKPHAVLDAAYDDALGVTAAFNLNLLRHLNVLMGANFDVTQWRHRGFFNPERSRVEMHLEARCDLMVAWDGGERRFAQGERVHTENSYKYTQQGAVQLLERAGFRMTHSWTDPANWYAVLHARVGTA